MAASKPPFVVGLTGGIGSGKSVVAELFAKKGVPVIDADVIARAVTAKDEPALHAITHQFGKHILLANGELDRAKLRAIIFQDQQARLWLESCLHPVILQRMQADIQQLSTPYCIAVIPLLFETNATHFIDRILVVDAAPEIQIKRASLRDHKSAADIADIMATQLSRAERLALADDVIVNDGSLEDLEIEVNRLNNFYQLSPRKGS